MDVNKCLEKQKVFGGLINQMLGCVLAFRYACLSFAMTYDG